MDSSVCHSDPTNDSQQSQRSMGPATYRATRSKSAFGRLCGRCTGPCGRLGAPQNDAYVSSVRTGCGFASQDSGGRHCFHCQMVRNRIQEAYNSNEEVVREAPVTIEQQVLEKLRDLPPEKQKEVLEFVDSLKEKKGSAKPRRSLLGLWADLNIHITEEDIAEARREMWGNFPRDIKL